MTLSLPVGALDATSAIETPLPPCTSSTVSVSGELSGTGCLKRTVGQVATAVTSGKPTESSTFRFPSDRLPWWP